MVSLSDIAREVHLSLSVVSRALSPRPDAHAVVKSETRELIRMTALRMGYRPNRVASFYGRGRDATIHCFLPLISDRLTADLTFGIAQAASEENFPVCFYRGGSESDFSMFLAGMLEDERSHSGLLTYPPAALSEKCVSLLREYHLRRDTILLLNTLTNTAKGRVDDEFISIPQVNIDESYGARLVARHLFVQGCRDFRYSSYRETDPWQSRVDGFCDEVHRLGCTAAPLSVSDDYRVLARSRHRIGIYADSDIHALNMLIMLARAGITPGDRVLLVGNDDKQQSRFSLPPLSTVHQPTLEEGRLAVRKLVRLIFGQSEKTELVRPYLVVRESSGGGPGERIYRQLEDFTQI